MLLYQFGFVITGGGGWGWGVGGDVCLHMPSVQHRLWKVFLIIEPIRRCGLNKPQSNNDKNRNPQGLSEYTACFNENKTDSLQTASGYAGAATPPAPALSIKVTLPLRKSTFPLWPHREVSISQLRSRHHFDSRKGGHEGKLSTPSWGGTQGSAWERTHLSVSGFTGAWHEKIRMLCICCLSHPLNITIYVCDLSCSENVSIMYMYIPYKQVHIKLKVHNPEYLETTGLDYSL